MTTTPFWGPDFDQLQAVDPQLADILLRELTRLRSGLQLIASENFTSPAVLAALGSANLLDSRIGRAIRALRGATTAAEAFGVDTARTKLVVFLHAALLAGISGWLYAHMQRAVNPSPFP